MVHVVRNSRAYAIGEILKYMLLWVAIFIIPALFVFMGSLSPQPAVNPLWGWAVIGAFLLFWLLHSRRWWRHLFDRSPQIELHTTFLRASQLDDDVLWKDVRDIQGTESRKDGFVIASALVLDVFDQGRVELDLMGLDTDMTRLYALATDARETDEERRRLGEAYDAEKEAAAPPAPVRTSGHTTEELGEEVARFGAEPGAWVAIVMGAGMMIALPAFGIALDVSKGKDVPSAGALAVGITGAAIGLPFILLGVAVGRVHLVLFRKGLRFSGYSNGCTLLYADIRRTFVLTSNGKPSSALLMLRDARLVQVSGISDVGAARERIEVLRRN